MNCIGWAPAEYGVTIIAGLSSGKIIVATFQQSDETWDQTIIDAHDSSVNSISIAKVDKSKLLNMNAPNGGLKFVS